MPQEHPQILKLIDHDRAIKNSHEIFFLKKGAFILDHVFHEIRKYIKIGASELEIALHIEKIMKKSGVKEVSFLPIVACGKNSAEIHHYPTKRKVQKGDFVMIDCGAAVKGYCSDMTRTFIFGSPNKTQEKILR